MKSCVLVLGTGSIGQRHLRVAQELGHGAVAMPTRAGGARPELASYRVVASWAEAIEAAASSSTRLAIIATNTSRHLGDALRAVEAKFDLLIEKPLAPTSDGVAELVRAVESSGRRAFVGCNLRFSRGFAEVRRKLPALGRIYSARVECQSYLPSWRPGTDHRTGYAARADEGGVTRDLVHEIDYTTALLGTPRSVFARLVNTGELGIEAEESSDLSWVAPGGAVVSVRLDYLSRVRRRRSLIVGERGELEWDAIEQTVTVRDAEGGIERIDVTQDRDDTMRAQLSAALAGCAGDDPGPIATLEDGVAAVGIIDAARASASSRQEELVVDWRRR